MRRIILISTIGLVLMCSCVVVAGIVVYQQSTMSVSALPLYPGAFNVQQGTLPGVTYMPYMPIQASGVLTGSSGSLQGSGVLTTGTTVTSQSVFSGPSGSQTLHFETTD